ENELRNRSEEGRTARQGEASEALAKPLAAMAQPASAELATRSNEDQKPGAAATPDESSASAQYDIESQKAERKRLRDAYKAECKRAGVRVTDEMIAHAASKNWTGRTSVQKWLAADPRYNGEPDRLIREVFLKKPHLTGSH